MNEDLPNPPRMTEDVSPFLIGLTPGWYRTADLYPRYVAWAEREGFAVKSRIGLGWAFHTLGLGWNRPSPHSSRKTWHVTEAWTQPNGQPAPDAP